MIEKERETEREEKKIKDSRLNGIGRAQNDGVGDESVLVLLDLSNHGGLHLSSVVVVNHSESSEELEEMKGEVSEGRKEGRKERELTPIAMAILRERKSRLAKALEEM